MYKIKRIIPGMVLFISIVLIMTGCKGSSEPEKQSEGSITETDETKDSDEMTQEPLYKYDVGANWRDAYTDDEYVFYYMNEAGDNYNKNIILSVTDEKALAGADRECVKESLRKQYGEDIYIENRVTKENGLDVIYIKMEQMNGQMKACISQYLVFGEKTVVIFSLYAEESRFETADKYADYVVNTVSFF